MLIARLDRVTQEINGLRELKQQAGNAEAYSTRARQLNEPSAQLESLATIVQEFQRRGISMTFDRSQVAALAKQVGAVAAAYHENPQSILDATEQRFTLWGPLKGLPDQVRDALLRAWSGYIGATLPEQQHPELLQTLRQLPGFQAPVEQISQLYQEAERMRRQIPQADEIDRVVAIASELKAAWAQLPSAGIPADVHDFLTAAVVGNARLTQLTGSVVEWLRMHKLVDSVRISLKA